MELTLQEYAIKTKQSLYSVIKQINSSKLNSHKKEINGKMVEFIYVDDTSEVKTLDYKKEYNELLKKYNELLSEYKKLL